MVQLTEVAVQKVKEILAQQPDPKPAGLRIVNTLLFWALVILALEII